ncbi:MAG: hypothetical protein ACREFY_18000, partial [Acetobacteraceae bacterium]
MQKRTLCPLDAEAATDPSQTRDGAASDPDSRHSDRNENQDFCPAPLPFENRALSNGKNWGHKYAMIYGYARVST